FLLFNVTGTSVIFTLSLHDALPIWELGPPRGRFRSCGLHLSFDRCNFRSHRLGSGLSNDHSRSRIEQVALASLFKSLQVVLPRRDRKSTRLNSSHEWISYAVFCLKK